MKKTLKALLKNRLTAKERSGATRAFDVIGDIAVIEIPRALRKKERLIAETLLNTHRNIKVVARKSGAHTGKFRLQKVKILSGERRKETVHKENGVKLKMNVEKAYFSPRLAAERKRISEQVKKNESVLVMFSGCAPYPLVISKNSDAKTVYGIEINPAAHSYGLENARLNKLGNVRLFSIES